MQIHQLRYALEVAKAKNFSVAAKNLFISQPSLSQQIIALEKELEITLFIRKPKSVALTDAGEYFIKSAERIVNQMDQLKDHMKLYRFLESGQIRLGMLWIAGYLSLSDVLTDYQMKYPGIQYSVKVEGSNKLYQMLQMRAINAAFIISTEKELEKEPDFYYHKIIEDYYVAVVSVDHPLAKKDYINIEDLDNEKVTMPVKQSAFYQALDAMFTNHQVTPQVICETSQSDLVIQMAEKNIAIGFASSSIAKVLKTDKFKMLPFKETINRTIYYVTLKELLDYPVIRSFTNFVEEYPFS